MRRALVALATFLAVLTPTQAQAVGGGVFSVRCVFSHTATVDPIVSPGVPSAHEHEFFGSRTTNADSTVADMQQSATSCPLSADTAGYWVPSLYKGGVRTDPVLIFAYYRSPPVTVLPFPSDLRIVAGGDTRSPPFPSRPQRSLSWSCVDSGPFFPQPPNCGDKRVKAHIHFPNCLQAGTTDSADHRSHMLYAAGKTCPSGFVMVPKLSMHVTYGLKNATGATLSSDGTQPGGTQLHADFWNTWDQDVLANLVSTCLNAGRSCKQVND